MTALSDAAFTWVEQWGAIDGSLSSDDEGRLVLLRGASADPDINRCARILVEEVRDVPGLADEIARVFILMLQAERPEGTTVQ